MRDRRYVWLTLLILVAVGVVLVRRRDRGPEYHRDVAPILARHCNECHRDGGLVPSMTLTTYPQAAFYGRLIRKTVAMREMPPWGVDNTGLCGKWHDARWLPDEDVATLVEWVERGVPEGKPRPEVPPSPRPIPPFRVDTSTEVPTYEPGLGRGGYRCFVLPYEGRPDALLRAVRLTAPDARGIHQVTLYGFASEEAERAAAAKQGAGGALGFPCYGTPPEGTRLLASLAAGDEVVRLTDEGGLRIPSRSLLAQVRFNISAPGRAYRTSLRLDLELGEGRELHFLDAHAQGELTPGARYAAARTDVRLDRPGRILGVVPRMHARGRAMSVTVTRSAGPGSCVATVEDWHVSSERYFRLIEPLRVAAADTIRVQCAFMTTGATAPVALAEGVEDEECRASLLVEDDDEADGTQRR